MAHNQKRPQLLFQEQAISDVSTKIGGKFQYQARKETPRSIGARDFNLAFDGDVTNRFTMTNFHTPYKVWSVNQDNGEVDPTDSNPASAIGSQVTKFTLDAFGLSCSC